MLFGKFVWGYCVYYSLKPLKNNGMVCFRRRGELQLVDYLFGRHAASEIVDLNHRVIDTQDLNFYFHVLAFTGLTSFPFTRRLFTDVQIAWYELLRADRQLVLFIKRTL